MNTNTSKQIAQNIGLFSVQVLTMGNLQYTWDFVMKDDHSIHFAGKTVIQQKQTSLCLLKASQIKSKIQFTIESNFTYPCKEYAYLPPQFFAKSFVEVRNFTSSPDKEVIKWFSNIAPLLLAIENNDSLLAAEIFNKNSNIFMLFPSLTLKLLEPIAVEGLFSWVWGRFDTQSLADAEIIFNGKCTKPLHCWGVSEAFFTAARRRLNGNNTANETIEECITRYFTSHPGTAITLGVVGGNYYRWAEKTLYKLQENKISKDLFLTAQSFIKAETDNPFDENALAVYLENSVSGYIRKSGARLLKKAFPKKTQFKSHIARLGSLQTGTAGVVVKIVI